MIHGNQTQAQSFKNLTVFCCRPFLLQTFHKFKSDFNILRICQTVIIYDMICRISEICTVDKMGAKCQE